MKSKFLFVFLDGVGLGSDEEDLNPFVVARTPNLSALVGGQLTCSLANKRSSKILFSPLDATLGFAGLPQSATGQTALVTGINAAKIMSGHYGPWPGPTLKSLLDQGTLFSEAQGLQGGGILGNAYPPQYFRALQDRRLRVNVPVYALLASGGELATIEQLSDRQAVSSDLTREELRKTNPKLAPLSPKEAGNDLGKIARGRAFTFFDFWISDRVGHRGNLQDAVKVVEKIDGFLGGVLEVLDQNITLIICSDHGNLEEMKIGLHTRNPVPLVVFGPEANRFKSATTITDVPLSICKAWDVHHTG